MSNANPLTNVIQIGNPLLPTFSDSPWTMGPAHDSITISGVTYGQNVAPGGKVRIKGAQRYYKLDVKDPQGANGATTTYRGARPWNFSIEFYMWTQAQWDAFMQNMLPAMLYGTAVNPSPGVALSVYHPALSRINISAILTESVGAAEPVGDGLEIWKVTARVREYSPNPPVNVTSTPQGQTGSPPQVPGTPVSPAVQALIDANDARRAALNAR